jgi:hypothetical protein
MTSIRLGMFLTLAALAAGQSSSSSKVIGSGAPEPKLPVVQRDACPRAVVFHVKLEKDVRMYSSWQEKRALVGSLKTGDKVTVLAGINIIREPDRALVRQPLVHALVAQPLVQAPPSLKPGDVIFRYGLNKYDYWNFWGKGAWFTEYIDQVVEKRASCDFPDERACYVKIIEYGIKEWWLQLKTRGGRTGWVLATKYTDAKDLGYTAFDGVCADPEADGD